MPPFILGQDGKIPPLKNQGWDTKFVFHGSTLVAYPKILPAMPLIGAVTDASGRPFPTRSSEVVSPPAGLPRSFHQPTSLCGTFRERMSSSTLFLPCTLARFFGFVKGQAENFSLRFSITPLPVHHNAPAAKVDEVVT